MSPPLHPPGTGGKGGAFRKFSTVDWLHRPVHTGRSPMRIAGWFSVQDESAMRVASALAPEPGETVLDVCAAPGGKTTHLAELMHDTGRIVACDVDEQRLQTVAALVQRLGLTIIETCRYGELGKLPILFLSAPLAHPMIAR